MLTLERLERTIGRGQLRLLRPPGAVPIIPSDLRRSETESVKLTVNGFVCDLSRWGVRARRKAT